jgi:tuberous sclerosis 1
MELETQLSKRDTMFTDQKRLLKAVKEEYEEKFQALEGKYGAQKAICIKMEEHILEIYRNQTTAVNPTSPESDKTGEWCLASRLLLHL